MKKNLFLLLFLCYIIAVTASAQAVIKVNKDEHDFGTIDEGVIATYEFEVTNEGNQPLIISEVQASCGCTTPYWTKEPILPKQKGKVSASYNSGGRPDAFVKSITIKSNATEQNKVVLIKGFVKAKTAQQNQMIKQNDNISLFSPTPNANNTPNNGAKKQPDARLEKVEHNFGDIEVKQRVKERFTIYNAGNAELLLLGFGSQCQCIQFGVNAEILQPGQIGTLELSYLPEEAKRMEDTFTIYTNDPAKQQINIKLRANVYENFGRSMFIEKKEVAPFEQ